MTNLTFNFQLSTYSIIIGSHLQLAIILPERFAHYRERGGTGCSFFLPLVMPYGGSDHGNSRVGILPTLQVFLVKTGVDESRIIFSFEESGILQHTLMERNRRLDAQNLILTQGTCHVGDGGFAGTPPATELAIIGS